tara:strand:- start:1117 stop:1677 length:561 start_codon:yes stop_codon:yes gene_type:complete
MATLILRPDSIVSSTGLNVSGNTLLGKINDNAAATTAIQNNVTANLTCTFGNDSAYTGGTINTLQVSVTGGSTGRGTPSASAILYNAAEGVLSETTMTFGGGTSTQDGDEASENADGGSLTPAIADGMFLVFTPNTTGMFIAEIFVTVDYDEASGFGHKVNSLASANVGKVNTVATANIGKINTVD